MKRPDLLVLIAVWEFVSAFGVLIGIAVLSSAFFFVSPGMWWWGHWWWNEPQFAGVAILILSIILLVMLAYFVLALMGGIGLLKGKSWGHILSIIHAALTLFWVPIGTVIGILAIIYLTKPEVSEYFKAGKQVG
jgi:hypothetical protein